MTDMGRQTRNTTSSLRRIQSSVYSGGRLVLAIHAVGKKRKDTGV